MEARSFSDASVSGREPGRPQSSGLVAPSPQARALIAAKRWQSKANVVGRKETQPRSSFMPGEISSLRGHEHREQKRFDREVQAPKTPES